MIRSLLCLTALSLVAQGPPPAKKPVGELPTLPPISSVSYTHLTLPTSDLV